MDSKLVQIDFMLAELAALTDLNKIDVLFNAVKFNHSYIKRIEPEILK